MKHQLIPFQTIQTALEGDIEAMSKILCHYERYIMKLSTKRYEDKYGNNFEYIDDDMKRQLEAKLIMKISDFKLY